MGIVKELIKTEADGGISFGDYTLAKKEKLEDFDHEGDLYKIKTYQAMTKLEKNGLFLYESVPGTAVNNLKVTAEGISFTVEGTEDAQLTIGLADETSYEVCVNSESIGTMKTSLGGKLNISVELNAGTAAEIEIKKA